MRKLTNEEFLNRLNKISITPLEPYINCRTKIKFKCNICNNEWITRPGTILNGCSCPECGKIKSANVKKWDLNNEKFLNRLDEKITNVIELLTEYNGHNKKILVKCKICDNIWKTTPSNIKRKQGCPKCGHKKTGEKTRLSQEKYEKYVKEAHNGTIKVLSKYKGGNNTIKYECLLCGEISEKRADRLKHRGCKKCNFSKGETKIQNILDENNIKYQYQYSFNNLRSKGKLFFDFAVFDKNNELSYLIEFDGKHHFESVKYFGGEKRYLRQLELDNIKNEYCIENNIKLIRISYKMLEKITIEDLR